MGDNNEYCTYSRISLPSLPPRIFPFPLLFCLFLFAFFLFSSVPPLPSPFPVSAGKKYCLIGTQYLTGARLERQRATTTRETPSRNLLRPTDSQPLLVSQREMPCVVGPRGAERATHRTVRIESFSFSLFLSRREYTYSE